MPPAIIPMRAYVARPHALLYPASYKCESGWRPKRAYSHHRDYRARLVACDHRVSFAVGLQPVGEPQGSAKLAPNVSSGAVNEKWLIQDSQRCRAWAGQFS